MVGYDYIVVGGGASGCALASRLSENRDIRVLLIEAGPPDRSFWLSIPAAAFRVAFDPRLSWGYETEPQPALGGRRLPLIQAKVMGGGTSINGMVYSRGAASDYNDWKTQGCDGWGYDDVLPYFKRTESNHRGGGPYHGGEGPIPVMRGRSELPMVELVAEALVQTGYRRLDDLCAPEPDGVGYYDWTISDGRRASVSASFPGVRGGRANLAIRTGVTVLKLVITNGRAEGVVIAAENGAVETVHADRETILCAGAVNTPKLLMLSGIGPADALRSKGIDVRFDQPGVGQNLQNHTTYRMEYEVDKPFSAYLYRTPTRALREVGRYLNGRGGFLSYSGAAFGGFYRSDPSYDRPDMQLFVAPAIVGRQKSPLGPMPERHGFTFAINQGRPYSRGFVALRSDDPRDPPVIDPRYFSDPRDIEDTVNAVERLREVAAAPALADLITRERHPGPKAATRDALRKLVRQDAGNHYHVAGTCRMGSDEDAVTDLHLRVRGVLGLRVADMSVAPTLMNGNTSPAAMMIAERAADFIKSEPCS